MKKEINYLRHLIFYLTLFLFIACETATDVKIEVKNNTNSSISFDAKSQHSPDHLSYTIQANQTKTMIYTSQRGGSDVAQNPSEYFTEFHLTNTDGDSLQKEYKNSDNWETDISGSGIVSKSYVHTYTFIVNESDF